MNEYYSIEDLPFNKKDKERTLEYLAQKLYRIILKFNDYYSHHKSYDPLTINENIAHSYTFDFEDGGRHHPIKSLSWIDDCLTNETERIIRTSVVEDVINVIYINEDIEPEVKKAIIRKIISELGLTEDQTSFPYFEKKLS